MRRADVIGVKDGQNQYEATSDDLHAWTEIYFEGAGWVSFEPTPGVGSATAFKEPGSPSTNTDSGNLPDSAGRDVPEERNGVDSTAPTASTAARTTPRAALITAAVLLVLFAAPGLVRLTRRRWKLRGSVRSPSRLWEELEATARDFAMFVTVTETPRVFASVLASRPGMDREALDRLLSAVERERYARPGTSIDATKDFWQVMRCLRSGATRVERLRAVVLPRSLAPRSSGTRTAPVPRPVVSL